MRAGRAAAVTLAGALAVAAPLGGCTALRGALVPDDVATDGTAAGLAVDDVSRADERMLDDLTAALVQLHVPRVTTLQVGTGADAPPAALVERLAGAGYGIQRVSDDQGAFHVTLERRVGGEAPAGGAAPDVTFALGVGATTLSRGYALDGARVRPATALAVGGTRRGVVLEDARFDDADPTLARVEYAASLPLPEDMPLIGLITDDVVRGVAREAARGRSGRGPGGRAPSVAAVNGGRVEVANLFYSDAGAFGGLRDRLESVERLVIVFADDSMRLGQEGKGRLARLVAAYRPESDTFGLVGCSNGPTALEIGNEGLALGRSGRVAEELLALGVARERILDEGCWSPASAGERFPSRGVVVELLRSAS